MVKKMEQEILQELLEKFPIPKGKKQKPYIILFDAYTGVGKSYVGKLIASKDGSIILNNDEVRNYLKDYNSKKVNDFQRMRLKMLLENNNSCIMDSCFCHNWEEKLDFYKKLGYKYYIVRLECEEDIIEMRLKKRKLDGINFSVATYQDYLWMKNNVSLVPNELIDFTINTSKEVEEQVEKLLRKINSKINFL